MSGTVLFAGAHTGGHLYPAIAVAHELRRFGVQCVFAGVGKEIERSILDPEPFPFTAVPEWANPADLPRGWAATRRLFSELSPAAVIGTGGAAALGPGARCAWSRRPLFLLEPNRVLGRANRWLLRFAARVFLAFPVTDGPRLLRRRSLVYGCPVRSPFRVAPLPEARSVLVLGGSQGSQELNGLVLEAARRCGGAGWRFHHVSGPGKTEALREGYSAAGIDAEVVEYEADVAEQLRSHSLVIARSGGSTVAEIAAVGRGACFVPYPHHKDRQQFRNAELAVSAGAAEVIDGDVDRLTETLKTLADDPARLQEMADASARLGRPDAASDIARVVATHIEELPSGAEKVA
ncbi:MAG: UDP-N-acetylglucosamine--N-acetylmuramyl-(pentapeptide) pyrophosphoryl-undecaprenol N-acetylglucosamine transferase [Planctomycetota bacterium]